MTGRVINTLGRSLIKTCEGCSLFSYRDQGGVITVGYGATGPGIVNGTVWTQEQADERLDADLAKFSAGVDRLTTGDITDNQFSALVSLAYNIGLGNYERSSARDLVNSGRLYAAPEHIRLWNEVAGKLSSGLLWRRQCEAGKPATTNEPFVPGLWQLPDGSPMPDWERFR